MHINNVESAQIDGRRAATGAGVDIKNRARLISDRSLTRVPFLRVIVSPCHLVKIRRNRNATSRPSTLRSESRNFPAQGDSIVPPPRVRSYLPEDRGPP